MKEIDEFLYRNLLRVTSPGRYLGVEVNSFHKPFDSTRVRWALVYPDVYELGMSHLGLAILYEILNEREDVLADRAYLPWTDMQELMALEGVPLFGLESRQPLRDFDLVGITLQHELNYANVLRILALSGIPLRSGERGAEDPLVVGGGPGAFNPEPLAEAFDLLVLGDGEEAVGDITEAVREWKGSASRDRRGFLRELSRLPGIYVPSLYRPRYREDGTLAEVEPLDGAPFPVRKRVLADLNAYLHPRRPLVPLVESVHDRASLEIFRGCTRGCRFCQAGYVYRPVRERDEELLVGLARDMVGSTGFEEISLTSLNSPDYSRIDSLAGRLAEEMEPHRVTVSLPSLRTDTFSVQLAGKLRRVRRAGLTFAPEAASEALRRSINKGVDEDDLYRALHAAHAEGWRRVKLYFMIGLPGEKEEDVEEIGKLLRRVLKGGGGREPLYGMHFTVSISTFVPKPHTPFQWVAQMSLSEVARRHFILRETLRIKGVTFRWHDREMSYVEGLLARGDRRLFPVVARAAERGCLDNWTEQFSFDRWQEAVRAEGLDMAWYVERERERDEVLPWDHLDCGVSKDFLWSEYERSLRGEPTPDCRFDACSQCGACSEEVRIRLATR